VPSAHPAATLRRKSAPSVSEREIRSAPEFSTARGFLQVLAPGSSFIVGSSRGVGSY
jgi:hypothetical protein